MLRVKDSGAGIDSEIIDKIFDPYFTTKKVGEGSGMGLAVVQGILNSHEAVIKVDSEAGKGTTFTIFFPVTNENIPDEQKTNESIPKGKENILIVDDEKTLVEIAKRIVEHLGYKATAVTSSLEALEIFKANPENFDLIISDQIMPEMTGNKLAEKILNIKNIPIIIYSGYSSEFGDIKNDNVGISAFIMKPVSKDKLARTIREVLDKQKK